jgi:glutathione synthase/RimK-type ligase-like ATP-grasp enzyme
MEAITVQPDDLTVPRGRSVRLLNRPAALLAAHDKLQTARWLADAGVAHTRTLHRRSIDEVRALEPPFVLKPRFAVGARSSCAAATGRTSRGAW